ncbi:MAG: HsdM family class I SAM-dependent methyltransferase [Thermoanaerobaculia bacterium]
MGYHNSPFYREIGEPADPSIAHLLRDAQRAQVQGAYFVRTTVDQTGGQHRAAVYVAQAATAADAREIHRLLWNQGSTPFLLVSLPSQVRVYTPFAYDVNDDTVGEVAVVDNLQTVGDALRFLHADSIDSGSLWQVQSKHLAEERRVDRALLTALRDLSTHLIHEHQMVQEVAHALVGRFVYLRYLRDRGILSDQWLTGEGVAPESVFSSNVRLSAFKRLTNAVDERFNGHIFPIDWSATTAPNAAAVHAAGRAFHGDTVGTGQTVLLSMFNFSYIPIELLSAIYEQFLHETGEGAERGAFYTAETLTDFVLSEVEGVKALAPGMKVLDPSCGSGVFLVLAYRRLVEQELRRTNQTKLTPRELRRILTSSIFGVERDRDACLVAEFSLILTLLSYIDPPELHRPPNLNFTFPSLHNSQIFEADFFDDASSFWRHELRFDWVVGNVPWVELDPNKSDQTHALSWMRKSRQATPVARYRLGDAFTWRVLERLANGGVAGLIIQASSLTNQQCSKYRKAFFTHNAVYRITNLSNLAYVAFPSAKEPGATLIYSHGNGEASDIIHFGPLLVNQPTSVSTSRHGRTPPWVLTVAESELQSIRVEEARRGAMETWKLALLGTPRDARALARLRKVFPITLGQLAEERGWALALGLQLRGNTGRPEDPNVSIASRQSDSSPGDETLAEARWFSQLRLLRKPRRLKGTPYQFIIPRHWLVPNNLGTYVRKGRWKGLGIARAPHLFLWNEFAAFSDVDFIMLHPDVGLSAPVADADWLRAVAVLWTSSITRYALVLTLSSNWGIGRSVIYYGAAQCVPVPRLTDAQVSTLAAFHERAAAKQAHSLHDDTDWQKEIDDVVLSVLAVPEQIALLARNFLQFRFPLLQGRTPTYLTAAPDEVQLRIYAARLKAELDGFMERKSRRHRVSVLRSRMGTVVSVDLQDDANTATVAVSAATAAVESNVEAILHAARRQYGQWIYVRRSVRVFSGRTIHICKPSMRLEWTETQALLDAADIIAEVAVLRGENDEHRYAH